MTVDALLMNAAMDDHRRQIEAAARYARYDIPARALRSVSRRRWRLHEPVVRPSSLEPHPDLVLDDVDTGVDADVESQLDASVPI